MGTADEMKGRAKEAAGVLSGDDALKREGQTDRVAGKLKDTLDGIVSKAKDIIDSATHRRPEK
jgi:uncharacterized protein YjbJ (UPF0337 family)